MATNLNRPGQVLSHLTTVEPAETPRRFAGVLILSLPQNATASISSRNGGIALLNTNDNIHAKSLNGGIFVKDGSGDINIDSVNGGLTLEMTPAWQGKGLQAHTRNGGIVVSFPTDYHVPTDIQVKNNLTTSCKAKLCQALEDTNPAGHLRFGEGPARLRPTSL
jgi:DUF4097 and DUF4098 domain-containing protein YvlB